MLHGKQQHDDPAHNHQLNLEKLESLYTRVSHRDRSVNCCLEDAINLLNGATAALCSPEFEDMDNELTGVTAIVQQGLDYVEIAYMKYLTEKKG